MTFAAAFSSVIVPFGIGLCIGLAVGVIAGIASTLRWLEHRRRQEKLVPVYRDDTNPTPGHVPWRGDEHLSKFGWLLAIIGTLAIIGSVVSLMNDRSISTCLSDFAKASAVTNQARAEAAEIDRDADDKARAATQDSVAAIAEIFTLPRDLDQATRERLTEEFKARFARNRDTLTAVDTEKHRADQIREEHPLPPQPAC